MSIILVKYSASYEQTFTVAIFNLKLQVLYRFTACCIINMFAEFWRIASDGMRILLLLCRFKKKASITCFFLVNRAHINEFREREHIFLFLNLKLNNLEVKQNVLRRF